jgi:predicted TIM-barrel fold metal-dependent hydrolase
MTVDLSGAHVVDVHCHGFAVDQLLAQSEAGVIDRMTVMGMCFLSSTTADPALANEVWAMTDSTVFAMAARRWLARYLGCDEVEVGTVRRKRLLDDPTGYLSALLADESIVGLLVDDGFPAAPRIAAADLQQLVATPVHRVARLEPMIERACQASGSFSAVEESFRAEMDDAGDAVAYKTVIAYRTGLDVTDPDRDDVESAFRAWRESGWTESRQTSKAVRDHFLGVAYEIAARQGGRPIHIHSGAGDPDVVLAHVRPTNLGPLLARTSSHPTVLIHGGFPWIEDAAYLASIYPRAYLDLSLHLPWATVAADRAIETALGLVPGSKVLYGSDEASEPEVLWISARLGRSAITRVLQRSVDHDMLTTRQAIDIGHAVLAGNTQRLHGLAV